MSVPMMNIAAFTGYRPLPVRIVRPDENSSFLPSPAIAQASTGELDLGRFTGDAIATIGPWPLIAEGQYAWLDIEGLSLSGDPRIVPIIQAHAVSSADLRNGLEAEVRRADLLAFRDGSTITVRCSVTFDQSFTKADGVAFPTATYRIRQVPAFGIDPSVMLLKVGESTQRTAFGGQLPCAYASSAPTVSRVDATGTVTATGEGSALTTASDGAGQNASFDVRVTSRTVYEDFESAPRRTPSIAPASRRCRPWPWVPLPWLAQASRPSRPVTPRRLLMRSRDRTYGLWFHNFCQLNDQNPLYLTEQDVLMNTPQAIDNTTGTPSRSLLLTVVKPETPHPSLPTPYVPEASAGELDLSTFPGDAHVAVARWPLIAEGQRIWLQIDGTSADGKAMTVSLLAAHALDVGDAEAGFNETIGRDDLKAFANGSTITTRCWVAFNRETEKHEAIAFPSTNYTIRLAAPLRIDLSTMMLKVGERRTRTASGGYPPYAYSSSSSAVVSIPDTWSGAVVAIAPGSAVVTARDADGDHKSYNVTVATPWLDDLTTFSSRTWEGWTPGRGATGASLINVAQINGKPGVFNPTNAASGFSGAIITRNFPTEPGAVYAISLYAGGGSKNPAMISTTANGVVVNPQTTISGSNIFLYEREFTASSTSTVIAVVNAQDTGNGNDFGITDIRVRRTR